MFSGIVETTSKILSIDLHQNILTCKINRPPSFTDIKIGDSIAVNGACLTITQLSHDFIAFDIIPETQHRSNLAFIKPDQHINLERAIRADARISGHFVQGHIDNTTLITHIETLGNTKVISFELPSSCHKFLIEKGFIAIDGMSLTISALNTTSFQIAFIPHTLANTIAQHYQIGSLVNIETDMMGKYLIHYLEQMHAK